VDILKNIDELTDIEEVKSITRYLLKENQDLKERIVKLEQEVSVLKKNSSNSSKPPSSDITKPKSERRQSGKRKQGGQKGHRGKSRERFKAEELDQHVELECSHCSKCKLDLSKENVIKVNKVQCVELVSKPVLKTEYKREGKFCSACEKVVYAELPEGVIAGQLCGVRLQSLIAYMKGHLGSSYSEISQYCSDVLGIELSRSMLNEIVSRASKAIETPYNKAKEALLKQCSLNIDETGWKDNGKLYWAWVFCNQKIGFFKLADSRGSRVLREVLGDVFSGAITSDFYSAYTAYSNEKQQFCLAHLIRDVKFLTTLPDKESQEFGEMTLKHFKCIFRLWHRRHNLTEKDILKKAHKVKITFHNFLCKTKLKKGKARTLQKRLLKRWDNLFCFFDYPQLFAPTNNNAEQTLRHLIRIRRHTQGTRSKKGRVWIERIMTVLESCRKQNRSPWDFILQSFEAFHGYNTYPVLLTT